MNVERTQCSVAGALCSLRKEAAEQEQRAWKVGMALMPASVETACAAD